MGPSPWSFAGCGAIAVGTLGPAGVAAAFGLAIMVMVFAFGLVSGAHLNPAVTAAFAVGRHFPMGRVLPYWAAQSRVRSREPRSCGRRSVTCRSA